MTVYLSAAIEFASTIFLDGHEVGWYDIGEFIAIESANATSTEFADQPIELDSVGRVTLFDNTGVEHVFTFRKTLPVTMADLAGEG